MLNCMSALARKFFIQIGCDENWHYYREANAKYHLIKEKLGTQSLHFSMDYKMSLFSHTTEHPMHQLRCINFMFRCKHTK